MNFLVFLSSWPFPGPENFVIVGDFNFSHVDDCNDIHARKFLTLLDNFDLKQLVSQSTHVHGHTLDLIITRSDDADFLLRGVYTSDVSFSDHSSVLFKLNHSKPIPMKTTVNHRSLSNIDFAAFNDDITSSLLFSDDCEDLSTQVTRYDEVLRSILDAHAPSRQRTIIVRPKAPWYTSEIVTQKKLRRKFERLWRRTKSQSHRREYQQQCRVVNDLLHASKQAHYHAKIKGNSHNQTFLFSTINKLLQKNTDRLYPSSTDDGTLANAFADFFAEKISKIRTAILETKSNLSVNFLVPVPCSARFSSFNEVDCSAVHRLLSSLSKKSCSLDPVPACVLMDAAILHCLFLLR